MKRINRIAAFVLAIILLMTSNSGTNLFYATETGGQGVSTSITGEDGLMVEATNSFGSLLANELETELESQEENNGCNVFSVEIHDTVAAVTFETTQYAVLVVGIYDETGTSMLAKGELEVMQGETEVYVDIDIETMPEYFLVRAFLIDEESMRPLCEVCESSMYTQEMQEFLSKTTDDFNVDKVLNLDDDKTNNFAVYSDETIIIPESGEYNKVTQCDEENNTYVIENIDSNISGLQSGSLFSYEYEEGNFLIVKVASIAIDGTTATIVGDDTSMEEVFDYVKIDGTSYTQDIIVDESTCEEGVIYEGDVEMEDDENGSETYAVDESAGVSYAKKFSFIDKKLDNSNAKLSGSIELKIDASIKLYIALDNKYLEVKLDYKAKAALAFSEKLEERSLPLAYFEVSPVPGIYIKFTPSIVAEVNAKIEVNTQLYGTIGFRASAQDGMKNLTTTPQFKAELKGEITVFVGLSMKPQVTIITEKLADASLTAKAGAEAKGTTTYSIESAVTSASNKIHDCTSCLDGDIHAKASVEFKANIFDSDTLTFKLSKTWSVKIADFYFSFDYGEFGFTSCPHYKYKVTFTVLEGIGKNLQNASITVSGTKITTLTEAGEEAEVTELCTNQEGKAEGYISNGKYIITVMKLGYNMENQQLTVEDDAVSEFVWMETLDGVDEDGEEGSDIDGGGDDEDIDVVVNRSQTSFSLGYGHSGVITEDGDLYMWGDNEYGQVGNGSTEDQLTPVKVLENVVSLSLGDSYSGAITEDGSLYMWGNSDAGQIGDGKYNYRCSPVKVLDNVTSVYTGDGHSGAITEDGSLYMWGRNDHGQLGNGSPKIITQSGPEKVLDNVESISLGFFCTGAITADGDLYMWGYNDDGKVGNGSTKDQYTPVKILENVVSLSLGDSHSGAITEDGSLYMWGNNDSGQVGNGMYSNQSSPVKVLENVVSLSLGDSHSGAITEDGSLYMWGNDDAGQVGNGMYSYQSQSRPVKVLENVVLLSLEGDFSGAITKDGSLYVWGSAYDSRISQRLDYGAIPEKIINGNVISVSLRECHGGAVTADGNLYMWGLNDYGKVGNGTTEDQLTPIKIMDNVKQPTNTQLNEPIQLMFMNLYTTENIYEDVEGQVLFTDLIPNETYNFYVMRDRQSTEAFSSENLLYITQAVSDDSGNLTVAYEPTEQVGDADIFIVQMSQIDLSSAEVELSDMKYTGELLYVNPVVTLNGTVLTEGKDYELLGDYSALEEGDYTVVVHGIGLYTGKIVVSYRVYNDEEKTRGDINNDGKVNLQDLMKCLHYISGRVSLMETELTVADINEDGKVTIADIMKMLHYISGRSEAL